MDDTITREGLILKLVKSIAAAEGKMLDARDSPAAMDRAYTLELVGAVTRAIDGGYPSSIEALMGDDTPLPP